MASGIYIVTIDSWTPVPVTQDKRYVDICARVDHTNVKVGKAKNLNVRHGNYENEFPSCNVQFRTIAHTEDIKAAERAVKQAIQPYRMRSPKGGLMEWLEGVPAGRVRELVLAALAESGVPHEVV